MSEERSTQESSRAESAAHAPVWSVTRRQHTELSPLRDSESGTQSYRSRTVTTTERVQVVQTPFGADGTDFPIEVLSSTGRSERSIESTTTEHGAGGIPVVGGVTADGVPIYSGIYFNPESRETTTIITTTTTTYRVFEVESDESAGEENGKEAELTINFPLECESAKYAETNGDMPEGEPFYVVIGKKDTASPTSEALEHVIKTVDIDLTARDAAAHEKCERSPLTLDGEHLKALDIYDAHDEVPNVKKTRNDVVTHSKLGFSEGSVASTSKAYEINGEPIEKYVSVYHNGRSDGLSMQDEQQITDEISTVVAKLSGSFKRAAIHGEHTIYLPVKGRSSRSHDHRRRYDHDPNAGGKGTKAQREMRSTYSVKFSDPFKIQQDIDQRTASTSKAEEIPAEDIAKYVSVYHSGWSDKPQWSPRRKRREQEETGTALEKDIKPALVVCTEETDLEERYEMQRMKDQKFELEHGDIYEQNKQFEGGTFSDAQHPVEDGVHIRLKTKLQETKESCRRHEEREDLCETISADIELREKPQISVTTIKIAERRDLRRSDEPVTKIVEKPPEVPIEEVTITTNRAQEVEGEPLEQYVSVYHSGRSDEIAPVKEEEQRPSIEVGEVITEAAQALGAKLTGLFKKSPAYLDYPTSEPYEGPVASTNRACEVEGEPLRTFVSVYHSGRSDEPVTKTVEQAPEVPIDYVAIVSPEVGVRGEVCATDLGVVVGAGFESYAGTEAAKREEIELCSLRRAQDLPELLLGAHASVYHSGRSDEGVFVSPPVFGRPLFDSVGCVYPRSEPYVGPLALLSYSPDMTQRSIWDSVRVYHSGRSDEPVSKVVMESAPLAELPILPTGMEKSTYGRPSRLVSDQVRDLLEYRVSDAIDVAYRVHSTALSRELEGEPIKAHVHVYHSGRSDEPAYKEIQPKGEISLGERAAPTDFLTSLSYQAPLTTLKRAREMEKAPLQHYVNVYGSGLIENTISKEEPERFPVAKPWSYAPADVLEPRQRPLPMVADTSFRDFSARAEVTTMASFPPSESATLFERQERPPEIPKHALPERTAPGVPIRHLYSYDVKETRIQKPRPPPPPRPCREIVEAAALARQKRLEKERRQIDFDVSISAKEPATTPVSKLPAATAFVERERTIREQGLGRPTVSVSSATATEPTDSLSDYYFKTREVDYWIGRHSERQSRPLRDLTADIGIDVASDEHWEEKQLSGQRRATSLQPESAYARSTRRDVPPRAAPISARSVSPTAHLHWTTVSETTSVSYSKKVSIERRRPRPRQPVELPSVRRQYRPPPPPPEVAAYGRASWTTFDSDLPRQYSGVAIHGESREARYSTHAQYGGPSSLRTPFTQPSTYYATSETKASVLAELSKSVYRNPLRYDLPSPVSPPRYEHWASERNNWTVEGSPRRFRTSEVQSRSGGRDESEYRGSRGPEILHYQNSNLEEIPIVSLMSELPMIEDGATECLYPTVQPIRTHDLPPGEHARSSRSAPLRRARQRIRNYCTML
uniref:ZU5 domain-containing protein n=1 Tax=Ascaris lumbricoides TaxID=6252 RepID=A0A0M3HVX5_ASCLU